MDLDVYIVVHCEPALKNAHLIAQLNLRAHAHAPASHVRATTI